MANRIRTFTLEAEGKFLEKLEELQVRTNILITDTMSQDELLGEILKHGVASYEESLEEMEKEMFEIC